MIIPQIKTINHRMYQGNYQSRDLFYGVCGYVVRLCSFLHKADSSCLLLKSLCIHKDQMLIKLQCSANPRSSQCCQCTACTESSPVTYVQHTCRHLNVAAEIQKHLYCMLVLNKVQFINQEKGLTLTELSSVCVFCCL